MASRRREMFINNIWVPINCTPMLENLNWWGGKGWPNKVRWGSSLAGMTNNANLAIQSNVEMQPAQPRVHLCKQCMWRHLVAKFETNKSGAIWWPNLQVMQMMLSGGQICSQSKKCHLVAKLSLSHGVNFWVRCASGNVCYACRKDLHLRT